MIKKYIIQRLAVDKKTIIYYKTTLGKGILHYVFKKEEATKLTKEQAKKMLNELNHKENFELVEVK